MLLFSSAMTTQPLAPEAMWLCREEHTTLRAELHDLKDCQVKFLSFSLLAAGTIFGAIGALWMPPVWLAFSSSRLLFS